MALAQVQRDLNERGLGLKVFDCYRPARAVAHFVRWARDVNDIKRKSEFYPDVDKRDLFAEGYIAERSGHSRGSTVDITLVRLGEGNGPPSELDMGGCFDLFIHGPGRAHAVGTPAHENRALLAAAMARHGFKRLRQGMVALHPGRRAVSDTYFDFPVK